MAVVGDLGGDGNTFLIGDVVDLGGDESGDFGGGGRTSSSLVRGGIGVGEEIEERELRFAKGSSSSRESELGTIVAVSTGIIG